VLASRHSAVTVVAGLAPGPLEALYLVSLWMVHKREVGIGVAADRVVAESYVVKTSAEPVLEVKLLVRSTNPAY
jgi:hypothetical protein